MLKDYGLTELFSESSEPPFTEFPFAEFKKLFPEGQYTFTGQTIAGVKVKSLVTLTAPRWLPRAVPTARCRVEGGAHTCPLGSDLACARSPIPGDRAPSRTTTARC